MTFAALEHYQ